MHLKVTGIPPLSSPDTTLSAHRESETPYEPHALIEIT
jgi:hypothetical protein